MPAEAILPLDRAVTMAHEVGLEDNHSEGALALARFRAGEVVYPDPERWATFAGPAALWIGLFWREHGEDDRAVTAALTAWRDAHNPGEPYVHRWLADQASALLADLSQTPPQMPAYDPAAHPPLPWEADVDAFIAELDAENAARDAKKEDDPEEP
jgi:hypothetical protein